MPALLVALILLVTATTPVESWTARTIVVHGTVRSEFGTPLRGANVFTTDAARPVSTGTGADGAFTMQVLVHDTATAVVLRVRSVGFRPVVTQTPITGDTISVHFVLRQDVNRLDEIIVTGGVAKSERTGHGIAVHRMGVAPMPAAPGRDPHNTEEYARIEDNRFLSVASAPRSTFSVDVDRASYTNVRRFITSGSLPPKDAVRIEELINYFQYDYDEPNGDHPVSITTDVTAAPWKPQHRIVRIGLQTARIPTAKLPPNNLVFLIDVSGSMQPSNKLPLVKQAFRLLVNELREQDRVAIVVYAGNAGLVLPSTSAADKQTILDAIERLEAGGSTAGGEGIRLAYDVARQHHIARGNNRVILATDGDFNVGVSSTSELVRYVEERRADGTALTVLGFGMGNYKDGRLEQLADKGNGNYAYIDGLLEAKKMFVQEMGATLLTVAKDVKLQVEFNPATVQAYRLIGYENRLMANEDFSDDRKDAGDIGAGHSVTALYEIVPVGVKTDVAIGTTDTLRYQVAAKPTAAHAGELLFVNVRYKLPRDSASTLLQRAVVDTRGNRSDDLRFALAVAGYGMLLRDSEFKGSITYDDVLALARDATGDDRLRLDFVSMVERTRRVASGVASREH